MSEIKENNKSAKKRNPAQQALEYLLKWGIPLAFTILLVGYMFRKVDFAEMLNLLSRGVDYWWILAAMLLSIVSHVIRAARWQIQLRGLDINASLMPLSCSIFGCYALNLIFPRLGEVWRCSYISRRERASFGKVLGSMVADRMCDSLMVLLLTVIAFAVASNAIESFLMKYPIGKGIIDLLGDLKFWIIAISLLIGVTLFFILGRKTKFVIKVRTWLVNMWQGFAAILSMDGKWKFLLLTIAIWGCYYVQLYVAFYAFDFTRDLCSQADLGYGLIPSLVAFVLSSIGMAIPSNGGLGPWNIAVMFGLAVYGISDAEGTAFSMLQWSGQTVMLILLGIFTMIYISRGGKKKSKN